MNDSNGETLRSYQAHVREYVEGTAHTVSGAVRDWIDGLLPGLPPGARLFEIGSAFGRDAAYIAAHGHAIECSDAVPAFVARLREQGIEARRFNLLTDRFETRYDLIFANAVMLHFTRTEFPLVLGKIIDALAPGGRFAFSLKQGRGEEWSDAKIGAPRFFCYWQPETLEPFLRGAGFADWTIEAVRTGRAHSDWLFVTARAA